MRRRSASTRWRTSTRTSRSWAACSALPPWGRAGIRLTRADASLIAALERSHLHPLWDRYKRITPVTPQAKDAPMHWSWREIEPFTARAAQEVGIEDVERRALILVNPAFGGETVTTHNLIGAFTVLEPGDKAVPHRHTAAAIRFATRAEGAVTIVNGKRCEMHEGDLVLTPPMCWHGHINQSSARTYRYTKNGGSVMPTLDLYFKRIEQRTRTMRATWNAICLVVSGEGRSTVGDKTFEWSPHDVFTIPHWTWAAHEPRAAAELFIVTDR